MRIQAPSILAAAIGMALIAAPSYAQVAGFSDVPRNHWAADSVGKLVQAGILSGPPAKKNAKPAASKFDGNKPVTRYELAVTLYHFVQAMEKADQQKKSKMGADITGPDAVKYLVNNGYLPKNSPLVSEGGKLVTANQLANSLTLVIARIKEKSVPITPGSKYAPN